MTVYLAATSDRQFCPLHNALYALESFYYFKDWQVPYLKIWRGFMLDSGAFTFMNSNGKAVDWDAYVERYAAFINKHDIELFFELDIDCLVGISEVERLRRKLEQLTGKQSIPVWHKSRGGEYFQRMCEEYNYIAIGGIVTKEIQPAEYAKLKHLIDIAHMNNCKIHGLGFTAMKWLPTLHFDSVDSTNWKSGGFFGQLHIFKGGLIQSYRPKGKRAKDYKQIDLHNFGEWCRFQRYAENNL